MRLRAISAKESTRRHVLAVAGLAVTTGLAGCQDEGDGDDSGATEREEGADGSDGSGGGDDGETAPESLAPPEGTSESGIDDTAALVDATRQALTENGYDLEQELVNTAGGEETLSVTQQRRSSLASERRLFVFDASTETNRIYIEGRTQYVRGTSNGETIVESRELERDFAGTHPPEMLNDGESLGGILRIGTYVPTETVQRNGRRLLRFELDSADESGISGRVTEATGSVFVDTESVVHEANMSLEIEDNDGQIVTVAQSFVVHQLGEISVERPDWVDETDWSEG